MSDQVPHAAWAAAARRSGAVMADVNPIDGQHLLICPHTAAQLLKACDGGANMPLAKPNKSPLLSHALTGVSGADWDRQRPAFLAAAGGGLSVQARRHAHAAQSAAALAAAIASSSAAAAADCPAPCSATQLGVLVASRGLAAAVLGPTEADDAGGGRGGVGGGGAGGGALRGRERLEALIATLIVRRRASMAAKSKASGGGQNRPWKVAASSAGRSSENPGDQGDPLNKAFLSSDAALLSALTEEAAAVASTAAAVVTAATAAAGAQAPAAGAAAAAAGAEPTGILARLLAREELTSEEAISNAGSCMVAGTDTSSLLVQNALLHLADSQDVQTAARAALRAAAATPGAAAEGEKLLAAIMRETLRVNPPVKGLPRRVVQPEGLSFRFQRAVPGPEGASAGHAGGAAAGGGGGGGGGAEDAEKDGLLELPFGFAFAVDLVSAAHGHPSSAIPAFHDASASAGTGSAAATKPPGLFSCCLPAAAKYAAADGVLGDGGRDDDGGLRLLVAEIPAGSSFQWDPLRREDSEDQKDTKDTEIARPGGTLQRAAALAEAAPWGMGPRKCPAGALSLVIAKEVLATLLLRFEWKRTYQHRSHGGDNGGRGSSSSVRADLIRFTAL